MIIKGAPAEQVHAATLAVDALCEGGFTVRTRRLHGS